MATIWGIAGAGKISHDFVTALKALPKGEHVVIAVASASGKNKAEEFAKKHNITNAYGTYEELATNDKIDVIYVGSLNPQHFPNSKLFLDNGKAVLCEKPLCMNYKEADILIKLAKKNNLFLMEALWTRYFPVYEELKQHLAAGTIGDVLQVDTSFGVKISTVDRLRLKELGGGTVLDLGVYALQLLVLIFGNNKPIALKALGHTNEDGVDESMSCILTYSGGRTAVISTHSKVELPNKSYIVGTKGTIEISRPMWSPTKIIVNGEEKVFPLPKVEGEFNFVNSVGLNYEAAEVRRCLLEGLKESPKASHADSLMIAYLEDAIRKQLGVELE
uniref:Trans-1,2-dihydrobenzene-1,2-diol dehydrogenase n=2 Tax=Clastoptera arizonana TaxID=38151 RepID=A0A1B6CSQ0_9HEMI